MSFIYPWENLEAWKNTRLIKDYLPQKHNLGAVLTKQQKYN